MPRIFAYIVHKGGVADDTALELLVAAAKIDATQATVAVVAGWGAELNTVCESLRDAYGEVWKIANQELAYPNAEVIRKALVNILPPGNVVLVPHNHFGVDLSPGLAIKLNAAYVPDVVDIEGVQGKSLNAIRQEYGGQVSTHVRAELSSGVVLNIRPGAFKSREVNSPRGMVVDKPVDTAVLSCGRRYLETIAPESGDVDITKHQVLVSIGRGIQEQENVAIAEELAELLGAAVSCSRPAVDAKWMEKSRQVGSSGKTVKPKVYIACGISGSFQHLAGLKGNPFIVAINKNPKAPIFQVADVGVVDDILEFLPEMTNKIREQQSVASR